MWAFCLSKEKIMGLLDDQLAIYKENYAKYRVTGDTHAKTVSETALATVQQMIADQQSVYENGTTYIQGFVNNVNTTNPQLVESHTRAHALANQVPQLQDQYEQTKMMMETHPPPPINYTPLFVKVGIVVALGIVAGLAASL
jgi:hypothetical protein